ncbi:MAG TPA: DUF1592 domain-containing protein, partial [Vicinamibacterales bacterium]|nr:DUF1592 domain-containing protein [Vicinamibacterales bacterium]
FRKEQDLAGSPVGSAHQVSELDLASRLSFFLWSSIPDDELLNLAIAGRLRAPGALDAQVRRMIADPRADALMNNSPASGCSFATWTRSRRTSCCSPTSMTTCVRHSVAKRSCSLRASCA